MDVFGKASGFARLPLQVHLGYECHLYRAEWLFALVVQAVCGARMVLCSLRDLGIFLSASTLISQSCTHESQGHGRHSLALDEGQVVASIVHYLRCHCFHPYGDYAP